MDNDKNMVEVEQNSSGALFDNLTILKELENIVNRVRDEDFLDTVPKEKLRRVKWPQIFNCLKQSILNDMIQQLNSMWQEEDMLNKLEVLEKQKEKYADNSSVAWRPQLGDVKGQLRAHDVANLQKQKRLLESLAREYEIRVNKLKRTLNGRRGFLKAMHLDITKYQKKNDETIIKMIEDKINNHNNNVDSILPYKIDLDRSFSEEFEGEMKMDRDST